MAHRSSVLLCVLIIATVLILIFNYFRKISVIKRQIEHSPPKKIVEFGDGEIGAVFNFMRQYYFRSLQNRNVLIIRFLFVHLLV
jgi:hypothetical protein